MTRTRLPARRDFLLALVFIAVALCAHRAYIHLAQPDVPYMDTMRMLVNQQAWREGKLSLLGLWEPASTHHGLIGPLLLLANVQFFHLDAMLANLATGWVIAAICVILAWTFLADRRALSPAPGGAGIAARAVAVALLVMLLFSWAGFELLTLELGLALWVKNLCFVAFFVAHAAWLRKPAPSLAAGLALAIAGAGIVLVVGMGWSYGFAGAVIATQALAWRAGSRGLAGGDRGGDAMLRWLPAAALVGALVVYAMAGHHAGQSARAPLAGSSLLLPFYALGSTWVSSEAFVKSGGSVHWLFVAGVVTALAGAWGLYRRWRRGIASGSLLPIYLMGYGAACALLFSAARGGWGIHGVIAPRYYMDLVLFLIGTSWLLYEDAEQAVAARRMNVRVFAWVAMVGLLVVTQTLWAYRLEWRTAPFRANAFDRMAEAFRRGARTPDDARLIQAPLPMATAGTAVMRARRLSLFAHDEAGTCSPEAVRYVEGWHRPEKHNRWMAKSAVIEVPPCGCAATASVYLPPMLPARDLVVDVDGVSNTLALAPGKVVALTLPAGTTWHTARVSVSRATVPATDLQGSADKRTLGALVGPLTFACPAAQP